MTRNTGPSQLVRNAVIFREPQTKVDSWGRSKTIPRAQERIAKKVRWDGDCLIFTGAKNTGPSGYGQISVNGVSHLVHRVVWMITNDVDSIPEGKRVKHTCETNACCNPEHLIIAAKGEADCAVEGCSRRDIQGGGMCQMHYYRRRRQGTPGEGARRQRESHGPCVIEGCDKIDCGPHGMCGMHWSRNVRNGDPLVKLTPRSQPLDQHWAWLPAGQETYASVHQRLRATQGSASNYDCVRCGRPARHWAYDHQDLNEQASKYGPFSADQTHYQPMCVPCHKRMDMARSARAS